MLLTIACHRDPHPDGNDVGDDCTCSGGEAASAVIIQAFSSERVVRDLAVPVV